jgi:outer membrane protein assembly factor BamB
MTRTFPHVAEVIRDGVRMPYRREPDVGGGGLMWIGLILALGTLILDLSTRTVAVLATAGLGLMVAGLWQLRRDHASISKVGLWVNGAALLTLAGLVWRLLAVPGDGVIALPTPAPSPTPEVAIVTEASPNAVLMHRGGPDHLGANPGPVPVGRPLPRLAIRQWRRALLLARDLRWDALHRQQIRLPLRYRRGDRGRALARRPRPVHRALLTAIAGDRIYVTNGYELIALVRETGERMWTQPISFAGTTSPTLFGNMIFVAGQSGGVYAFHQDTGEQRWHIQTTGLLFASPTVIDGHVFVANDSGKLIAIHPDSGQIQWKFEAGSGIFAPVAASDGRIIFSTTTGTTYALEPLHGQILWQFAGGGTSGVAVAGDVVVVGSDGGGVSGLDADTGEQLWLIPTGATIRSAPTVSGNVAIVASGRTLYGLNITAGEQLWTFGVGYAIETSPVIVDSTIFVGGRDGFLDAIIGDVVAPAP